MATLNRQQTVEIFCQRLEQLIEQSGLSRSAFATALGLDRSTLSQLLSANNDRLPRAETIVALAGLCQVSIDWLLGLTQINQPDAQLVSSAPEIESGAGNRLDARLKQWHSEAVGYKIRYVPASLPDLLKTEEVVRYEYREHDRDIPDMRVEQTEERLAYSRRPETDMEVCSSFQSLEVFFRGEGVWQALPIEKRRAQLEWMIALGDELYPTFRWFLYDGRRHFSAPYTIFGPQRAAIYIGDMFFVFSATEQIRVLTRHFDNLIRAAVIQPPDVPAYLQKLLQP